jgi:hypothetical protein
MLGSVLANLARQEYSRDGVRGSLSLGERAGVRGKGAPKCLSHSNPH